MLHSPKITPFFEETASTTLLKIHSPKTRGPRKPLFTWYTADYTLYHIRANAGFQYLPPIYGNFVETAIFSTRDVFISDEKGLSPAAISEKKLFTAIISGKLQGVLGGGENTFFPHDFFFISYFIFHNIVMNCIVTLATISVSHNCSLLSLT